MEPVGGANTDIVVKDKIAIVGMADLAIPDLQPVFFDCIGHGSVHVETHPTGFC